MEATRFEASLNGRPVPGEPFTDFNELKELENIFEHLGWHYKLARKGLGGYYLFNINDGKQDIKLHIYLKRVTFGGREARPFEKRVQFSALLDRAGFAAEQTEAEFSVILGIYKSDKFPDTVICAWNIHDWGHNMGRAFNCFVDVTTIAQALKENTIVEHITSKGQIACCFRPEHLPYYFEHKQQLYQGDYQGSNDTQKKIKLVAEIAGKGPRKPQLDIPIESIDLDPLNPRIVSYTSGNTNLSQIDLTSILYEYFDTQTVAMSLVANGYFDEEPAIVVPTSLPAGFSFEDFSDVDELAQAIDELIQKKEIKFTVVEGNRRVSTIKLLTNRTLREKIGVEKSYPSITNPDVEDDLKAIPCIIYSSREQVSSYLGVRHIAGLLKWEAFAKAAYINETIENEIQKGTDDAEAVKRVQEVVGDRSDTIKKQYVAYKLFLEARDDLQFDVKPIVNNFSLVTVLYNSPGIREYMNVPSYSRVDLKERIVPTDSLKNFEDVLTWIFGNSKTGEQPVLTDSRNITNKLSYVVNNESARDYLIKYKDLDGAFEHTNGEKEFLSKNLSKAARAIQTSLQFAFKYKNDENLLKQVQELEELLNALKSNLS